MAVAPVIHICGWPGVGKRTIGRIVADLLGGRLIHNHLILDAARALYARDTPESVAMREEVRGVILSHAVRLPDEVAIVLTDALAADDPSALPLYQPTLDLARDRRAPLRPFVLDLSLAENERRLTDASRVGSDKLMDVAVLRDIRATDRLFEPDGAVVLDVTGLSPLEAAAMICAEVAPADA